MSVSLGRLDSLVGLSFSASDFSGLDIQSFSSVVNASETGSNLVQVGLTTTGVESDVPGNYPTQTWTVASVDDKDNIISFSVPITNSFTASVAEGVLACGPSGILVGANEVQELQDNFNADSLGVYLDSTSLAILAPSPLPAGEAFTFTPTGISTLGSSGFAVLDQTSGTMINSSGTAYTGPVQGITSEFVTDTSDILNITAQSPNSFIEIAAAPGGAPPIQAGINVSAANGNNILDAYANSNFYTGGFGVDQFYIDTRTLTQNSWSTVVNFHSGDNITLWGVTAADFTLDWIGDTYGAAGATGLTGVLVPTTSGQPEAAVTLAGFTTADLTDGKLTVTYGQTAATNGVAGSTYMEIHGN